RAAAKLVVACALGNESPVTTEVSGSKPASSGRGRRTANLIAVLRPYEAATTPAPFSQAFRLEGSLASVAAPASPSASQHAACSPVRENAAIARSRAGV